MKVKRWTTILVVAGALGLAGHNLAAFTINIDNSATPGRTWLISGYTGWLSTSTSVTLPAGSFTMLTTWGYSNFTFDVDGSGLIQNISSAARSGNGTSTLVMGGFPISVDASAIGGISWMIYGVYGWAAGNANVVLAPGTYLTYHAYGQTSFYFDIDAAGNIQNITNPLASGAGGTTLYFGSHLVNVDSTGIGTTSWLISSIAGWFTSSQTGIPITEGTHTMQTAYGAGAPFNFDIDSAGLFQNITSPTASGAGTSTLVLSQPTIYVDKTLMTGPFNILSVSGWVYSSGTISIPAGTYSIINWSNPVATFTVDSNGIITSLTPTIPGLATGLGTSTLTLVGLPFNVDASEIPGTSWLINPVYGWAFGNYSVYLAPGTYSFLTAYGAGVNVTFTVDNDGNLSGISPANASLSGIGTNTLYICPGPCVDCATLIPGVFAELCLLGVATSNLELYNRALGLAQTAADNNCICYGDANCIADMLDQLDVPLAP